MHAPPTLTDPAVSVACKGLIVSFCNPPDRMIGIVRHDGREFVPLPVQPAEQFTGLAADETNLYLATGRRTVAHVVALDRTTWTAAWDSPIPHAADVHSIAVDRGALYVVSTGTDSVIRYRLDHGLGDPEVIWSPTGAAEDTHHLNGIVVTDGSVVVSGFAPRLGELWSSARDGYLYDITRDSVIVKGVYHPHSVLAWQGELWWCESVTGTVYSSSGSQCTIDGYVRGLAPLGDDLLAVGSSIGRHAGDRSIGNPADPGPAAGRSGITIVDVATGTERGFVSTGHIGPEVYGCWTRLGGA